MENSFTISKTFIASISEKADNIFVILGTGSLAQDLQKKLRLLGLNVPYLIGDRDSDGIRHYRRLSEISDPKSYFFIVCYDKDQRWLTAPSLSVVYKLLGVVGKHHPQVARLTVDAIIAEDAEQWYSDIFSISSVTSNGLPYVRYGESADDNDCFKIQVWGGSGCTSSLSYSEHSWPELMYGFLREAGFNAVVYSWGQWLNSHSDCLLRFMRDGLSQKPDLVIFYTTRPDFNPLGFNAKNALPIRFGVEVHEFIRSVNNEYFSSILGNISNGVNFDEDMANTWTIRHRVMNTLSKISGFTLWDCISPHTLILPGEQARLLSGRSVGYLSRERKRKDDVIAAARNYGIVKDFSDIFIDEEDAFPFFLDEGHLTDKGCELIAKRFASEILNEFGSNM